LAHIEKCKSCLEEYEIHDQYIANLIEQSARKEAYGSSQQNSVRRFIENLFLGDARQRGATHQWMYDRINLKAILIKIGYKKIIIQDYKNSLIPNWYDYGFNIDENGNEYKPGSLYMEAIK
jgi:hypothetical protein